MGGGVSMVVPRSKGRWEPFVCSLSAEIRRTSSREGLACGSQQDATGCSMLLKPERELINKSGPSWILNLYFPQHEYSRGVGAGATKGMRPLEADRLNSQSQCLRQSAIPYIEFREVSKAFGREMRFSDPSQF